MAETRHGKREGNGKEELANEQEELGTLCENAMRVSEREQRKERKGDQGRAADPLFSLLGMSFDERMKESMKREGRKEGRREKMKRDQKLRQNNSFS